MYIISVAKALKKTYLHKTVKGLNPGVISRKKNIVQNNSSSRSHFQDYVHPEDQTQPFDIYISYTVPKKYKRRMHEKFPSLHWGSYKANLLKMAELDGEKNFFQGLILIE